MLRHHLYLLLPGLVALLCCQPAQAQDSTKRSRLGRFMHRLMKDTASPGKTRILIYPSIGYAPETSFEFGISSAIMFTARGDVRRNRLCQVATRVFYTLRDQYGLWNDHAIYTDQDSWFLLGRLRLQDFPLKYFGIGPRSRKEDGYIIAGRYLLIRERILKGLGHKIFAGPQIDVQKLWAPKQQPEPPQPGEPYPLPLPPGGGGNFAAGLGLTAVLDSRSNYLNPRTGWFTEAGLIKYFRALGTDYPFSIASLDVRHYVRPVMASQVLALQFQAQTMIRGDAPFNLLPLVGGEQLMRGYYLGRYRDRNYLAAQAEYRFLPLPFSRHVGATLFAAFGAVAPRLEDFNRSRGLFATGGGLRYLLMPQKDLFIRLDAGFTREGYGLYFALGEAF